MSLKEQIAHDKAIVDAWPESVREMYRRKLANIFHNPGWTFPKPRSRHERQD